jgi:hypothetical protein
MSATLGTVEKARKAHPSEVGLLKRLPRFPLPWVCLGIGLALIVVAASLPADLLNGLRFFLLIGGSTAAGIGLGRHLRSTGWEFSQRLETSILFSLSGLSACLAYFATPEAWDSAKLFYGVVVIALVSGAVIVLLPSLGRRIAISIFVLFHFAGIAVTITSVDPPSGSGPWLSKQLYHRFYRPYLSFLYMTNAYHFYSPEPGAPGLMWFALRYSDGSVEWEYLPDRDKSPIGMHYQRMLALPEHAFSTVSQEPSSYLVNRRIQGSRIHKPDPIPIVTDWNLTYQYRPPLKHYEPLIASVVRRVFLEAPKKPNAKLVSIKAYRVQLSLIPPNKIAEGENPLELTRYLPYFLGEFDAEGRLKDPDDPFLYWYLPIVYVPSTYPYGVSEYQPGIPGVRVNVDYEKKTKDSNKMRLLNSLEIHALGYTSK